ncbi:1-deoxy-D-xylulose-5-phosphate synthase [Actinomycetaceae bacterium MB13-C1-2]|nr:1-deoxy-D-xylulose-5-phosphate synthase [Actinomycetaceae bacterium MB13-C1-2]
MTRSQDSKHPVLDRINSPEDLRDLTPAELVLLAEEIRAYLISSISRTGGHLGPNLGVVELTLALHRVFHSPLDTLVWDTGHQSYVHKLLTGRKDFGDLRQAGGLSGYPSRAESIHDVVENSHASTALSWADGIAMQKLRRGDKSSTVAVIGDGALTGGMAWEALNNISDGPQVPLVVVVNDNGRSYAPTVGGLAHHLDGLRTSVKYEETLSWAKRTLNSMGPVGERTYDALHGLKTGIKDVIVQQTMFSDLDVKYIGPVDGHDQIALELALEQAKSFRAPVLVHVITQKGRGYTPAEEDIADRFHAVGRIHPETGLPVTPQRFGWTKVFAEHIVKAAASNDDIVGVTAAMMAPVGLQPLADQFPDRVYDVGIAEQHAFTFAAGMAYEGAHPVVCVYATFMNRAFDQLLMDVALHHAPVTIVLDRAGLTGEDGPSHNGMWDLALAAMVPGLRVCAPRDEATLRRGIDEATSWDQGPTLLRYPKGAPPEDLEVVRQQDGIDVLFESVSESPSVSVLIVAVGATAVEAVRSGEELAGQGFAVTVVDPVWVLPVNSALIDMAASFDVVVSVEDGLESGGVGSEIERLIGEERDQVVHVLGVPRAFLPQSTRTDLLHEFGLDSEGIVDASKRAAATVTTDRTTEGH